MGLFQKVVATRCRGELDPACPEYANHSNLPPHKKFCECGSPVEPVFVTNTWAVIAAAALVLAVLATGAWLVLRSRGGGEAGPSPAETATAPAAPSESAAPAQAGTGEAPVSLRVELELEKGGIIPAGTVFRTGQKVRFHFQSSVNGYVAVWALLGNGSWARLTPTPDDAGKGLALVGGVPSVTPLWFGFNPPVHDETLMVYFSTRGEDLPAGTTAAADGLPPATAGLTATGDGPASVLNLPETGLSAHRMVLKHVQPE